MVTAVSTLPSPPSRADPTNFATAGDNWNAALATFQTELNVAIGEINAIASAAFTATSSTSNSIAGSGNKTFTVAANLAFSAGQPIVAASVSGPTNYMIGTVYSYSGTTLIITVSSSGGSGTKTDWAIGLIPSGSGYATLTGSETLTNKTLTAPTINTPTITAATVTLTGTASGTTAGKLGYLSGALTYGDGSNQRTVANLAEAQTFTNKTLTNPTLTGYVETTYDITDGAAFEINPANGTIQGIVLGASRTPKGTNFANGQSVLLGIDDGTAYTLTWTDTTFGASGVKWIDGTAPTLATSGLTWVSLWKKGGQVYGAVPGSTA